MDPRLVKINKLGFVRLVKHARETGTNIELFDRHLVVDDSVPGCFTGKCIICGEPARKTGTDWAYWIVRTKRTKSETGPFCNICDRLVHKELGYEQFA